MCCKVCVLLIFGVACFCATGFWWVVEMVRSKKLLLDGIKAHHSDTGKLFPMRHSDPEKNAEREEREEEEGRKRKREKREQEKKK